MAASARTLRVVNLLALMARVLRGAADKIDPPPPAVREVRITSDRPAVLFEVDSAAFMAILTERIGHDGRR
jgi:hypothetical protein